MAEAYLLQDPIYDRSLCMAGAYVWQEAGAYMYGRIIYMAVAYISLQKKACNIMKKTC